MRFLYLSNYAGLPSRAGGSPFCTRYVLDRKAGNFRDVIDALKIFGIGGSSAFGPGGLAIGGLQFYISSSTCVASSPKIVRIRYLPQLFGIPAGP